MKRLGSVECFSKRQNCPVCGPASGILRSMYYVRGFEILRCDACGTGITSPDRQIDPHNLYTSTYFRGETPDGYADYQGSEGVLRVEARRSLAALRNAGRFSGRLLEIGCAYGFFLQEASPFFDVSGIEICSEAAAHCSSLGLDVHAGATEDLLTHLVPSSADAVVMLDVVEHPQSPRAVLQSTTTVCLVEGTFLSRLETGVRLWRAY